MTWGEAAREVKDDENYLFGKELGWCGLRLLGPSRAADRRSDWGADDQSGEHLAPAATLVLCRQVEALLLQVSLKRCR